MSTLPDGTKLGRNEIIGRRIIEIVQHSTLEKGLDCAMTFYRLDSGVTTFLPLEDQGCFTAEAPTPECTLFVHDLLSSSILGRRIVQVLRDGPDVKGGFDSPYLILENGYAVTNAASYPHGVGYAGIHVFAPSELDLSKRVDFFRE